MSRRFVTDGSRLRVATTLRAMLVRGYSADDLRADASAGVVLGIVALPLSMALAIAAGAPPEYGLFTAIVAGIVIAVFGGSMHWRAIGSGKGSLTSVTDFPKHVGRTSRSDW